MCVGSWYLEECIGYVVGLEDVLFEEFVEWLF